MWVEQQTAEQCETRVTFSDPLWKTQTHLVSMQFFTGFFTD